MTPPPIGEALEASAGSGSRRTRSRPDPGDPLRHSPVPHPPGGHRPGHGGDDAWSCLKAAARADPGGRARRLRGLPGPRRPHHDRPAPDLGAAPVLVGAWSRRRSSTRATCSSSRRAMTWQEAMNTCMEQIKPNWVAWTISLVPLCLVAQLGRPGLLRGRVRHRSDRGAWPRATPTSAPWAREASRRRTGLRPPLGSARTGRPCARLRAPG